MLGKFTAIPYSKVNWYTNPAQSKLFRQAGEGLYDVYSRLHIRRASRYRSSYILAQENNLMIEPEIRASVHKGEKEEVLYHSSAESTKILESRPPSRTPYNPGKI